MDSADIKSCRKASLPTQGVIQIKKEKAQQSHEQFDSNGLTERKSGDEESFRSRVRPCPILSSSEDEQGVTRIEKEKSCQSHEQINSNRLTKTRRNNLKNKTSFRARAKPGPSSRVSSSEDEEEEIASRDLMKRGKKPRCHLRNIKV